MTDTPEINTANDFFFGTNGETVGPPMLPVVIRTRQQAYRTAAWLELMGSMLPPEEGDPSFDDVRTAIANT